MTLVFIKKMGPSKNCALGPPKASSGTGGEFVLFTLLSFLLSLCAGMMSVDFPYLPNNWKCSILNLQFPNENCKK